MKPYVPFALGAAILASLVGGYFIFSAPDEKPKTPIINADNIIYGIEFTVPEEKAIRKACAESVEADGVTPISGKHCECLMKQMQQRTTRQHRAILILAMGGEKRKALDTHEVFTGTGVSAENMDQLAKELSKANLEAVKYCRDEK